MKAESFVRGMVKTVFILCYIAFMWASIHHVATYFNNFEQGDGDLAGSYALAGAFDITALVTTIGVMFFRKSMPRWVLIIVWVFILATAGYSFFINWEYASHYQNMDLIMQPTGATTPVYDTQGVLHYVPVMRANTSLLWVNPLLASGFTIFSLIYSVIAEFFGTKPPSAEELTARKKYLEETSGILAEIQKLEEQNKQPSLLERAKDVAKEVKTGAKELSGEKKEKKDPQTIMLEKVISFFRATPHLLMDESYAESSDQIIKDLLKLRKLEQAKAWRIQAAEILRKETEPEQKTEEEEAEITLDPMPIRLQQALEYLSVNPDASDEELAEHMELKRPASARFWRLKATEILQADGTIHSLFMEQRAELPEENASSEDGTENLSFVAPLSEVIGNEDDEKDGTKNGRDTDPEMEVMFAEDRSSDGTDEELESSIPHTSTMRFTRRKPMTVLQVAEVLNCTERHVRNLRTKGQLTPDSSDPKNLITAASVKTYIENRTRKVKIS